jgi:hypothetical protein
MKCLLNLTYVIRVVVGVCQGVVPILDKIFTIIFAQTYLLSQDAVLAAAYLGV